MGLLLIYLPLAPGENPAPKLGSFSFLPDPSVQHSPPSKRKLPKVDTYNSWESWRACSAFLPLKKRWKEHVKTRSSRDGIQSSTCQPPGAKQGRGMQIYNCTQLQSLVQPGRHTGLHLPKDIPLIHCQGWDRTGNMIHAKPTPSVRLKINSNPRSSCISFSLCQHPLWAEETESKIWIPTMFPHKTAQQQKWAIDIFL